VRYAPFTNFWEKPKENVGRRKIDIDRIRNQTGTEGKVASIFKTIFILFI
jgi:hypothetical protein